MYTKLQTTYYYNKPYTGNYSACLSTTQGAELPQLCWSPYDKLQAIWPTIMATLAAAVIALCLRLDRMFVRQSAVPQRPGFFHSQISHVCILHSYQFVIHILTSKQIELVRYEDWNLISLIFSAPCCVGFSELAKQFYLQTVDITVIFVC